MYLKIVVPDKAHYSSQNPLKHYSEECTYLIECDTLAWRYHMFSNKKEAHKTIYKDKKTVFSWRTGDPWTEGGELNKEVMAHVDSAGNGLFLLIDTYQRERYLETIGLSRGNAYIENGEGITIDRLWFEVV